MLWVAPLGSGQRLGAEVIKAAAMAPSPPAFCTEEKEGAEAGDKPCLSQLSP